MSRYNNEFDEDDDGEELEITDEEGVASDKEGRELAAVLMAHCESVVGNRKVHEDQRRMWFRLAKKALAEGAERREAAEAEEEGRREADRCEEEARIAREEEERHEREVVEREERRAEIRWRNAQAARIEAEAARARVVSAPPVERSSAPITSPALRPSLAPTASVRRTPSATPNRRSPMVAPTPIRPSAPERAVRVAAPAAVPPRKPAQPSVVAPRPTQLPSAAAPARASCVEASPVVARESEQALTGADLLRWRTRRGITQRAAAEELGVAPSTIAKAELVPSKRVGEQLQLALHAALDQ